MTSSDSHSRSRPSYGGSTVTHDAAAAAAATTVDSQVTSIAPPSPSSRAPLPHDSLSPRCSHHPKAASPVVVDDVHVDSYSYPPQSMSVPPPTFTPMPPPPPPPPMIIPDEAPRVDYLLHNGGLPHLIPRTLLPTATTPPPVQAYQTYASPRPPNQPNPANDSVKIFAPIHSRLDDIQRVLAKNGSVAVATGYRSVARRLLDRLESVFARNISSERCDCVMCKNRPQLHMSDEEEKGVSWGEILEFVAGRRELPQWPPFTIAPGATGLGVSGLEPMQKLDPDVPPEWRDHYKKQNAKTKSAVQTWLSQQEDAPSSPPTEVDDDTLTFAILTHIDPERRPYFISLMRGTSDMPPPDGREPSQPQRNDVLPKVSMALQRLYRLSSPPRAAECCIYLLNNPELHNTLFTLAAVTQGEWDILVSGRFDGFLWSGAEAPLSSQVYASGVNIPRGPSRGPIPFGANGGIPPTSSRTNTPFSPLRNVIPPEANLFPSRGPTPSPSMGGVSLSGAATPAPVQMDEETEIAVLAEVEREIFRGMEDLEDQFEKLHFQAEAVRQRLRERSAGLAMQAQARRGSLASEPGARMGTPASMVMGAGGPWSPDPQEGVYLDDAKSELAPDDSASNIGFGRRHRRDGRHSRRTPAPVAEEEEDERVEKKGSGGGGGGSSGGGAFGSFRRLRRG